MSNNRRKFRLKTVAISLGCDCRKPKLADVFQPKSSNNKPKNYHSHNKPHLYTSSSSNPWFRPTLSPSSSASSSSIAAATATTILDSSSSSSASAAYCSDPEPYNSKNFGKFGFGRIDDVGDRGAVAVEKDSDDPYLDFRRSMLQMILEKEIYSREELRELLSCFLQLNDPHHHGIIIRAFTEIWHGIFSFRAALTPRSYYHLGRRSRDICSSPHVQ